LRQENLGDALKGRKKVGNEFQGLQEFGARSLRSAGLPENPTARKNEVASGIWNWEKLWKECGSPGGPGYDS
jgi:hypothetical protein